MVVGELTVPYIALMFGDAAIVNRRMNNSYSKNMKKLEVKIILQCLKKRVLQRV